MKVLKIRNKISVLYGLVMSKVCFVIMKLILYRYFKIMIYLYWQNMEG